MNLKNIINEIEKADLEVYEQTAGRRDVLKSFGAKVALASLPLALGSLFNNKAAAKTTDTADVIAALNFSLELEYFHYTFYRTANNTGGLIPAGDLPGFQTIEAQEKAHVNFLIATITALGGVPFKPNHFTAPTTQAPFVPAAYDFTASANTTYAPLFFNVFVDYTQFLIAASTFKDTMIRAYNGQLQYYAGTALYTQMQQLAAAEGRHAAFVRLIRRNMGASEIPAPWISNNIPPIIPLQGNYIGEDNTAQMNIDIASLAGVTGTVPKVSATAAFDEPMDKATVTTFFAPFIRP
jgi:Ferritin-like domain